MCTDIHVGEESLNVGMEFGCLQILDDGSEYLQILDEETTGMDIEDILRAKESKHYKCKCKLCGKIRYYSYETLRTEPKVCYKPLYFSTKHYYSTKACNANYRKKKEYCYNESVDLVDDMNAVIPSDEYCDFWNRKQAKALLQRSKKEAEIFATIPRKYAKNYDIDYVGSIYESLEVIECVDEKQESNPTFHFNQRHQKIYNDVIIRKQYRCRCYLCGKEQLVTCDEFGIFPPTEYGYRAYDGYWSKIFCDCHRISSFQWIVNDILIKHHVKYRVEMAGTDLLGCDNITPLRFDFAVYCGEQVVAYIECQGEQHYKPVKEFGGEYRFEIQKKNDEKKRQYAKENCIKLIEISYKNKKYEKIEARLRDESII